MHNRRYDRNADQLAQIYWHLNRMPDSPYVDANNTRAELIETIQKALKLNDDLGKMAEKGLI